MKNKVISSTLFIILGALIILAPTIIFPVCGGEMKMKCFYAKQVEIAIGTLVVLLGAINLFLEEKVRAGISIAIAGIGILALATPIWITGVCGSNEMICHIATRPLLVVLGILTVIISTVNSIFLLIKGK